MEARYFKPSRDRAVICELCPHNCLIFPGKTGKCRVRINRGGELHAETYENLSATHFDPIEKKPLYNFHPGAEIFSLGSLGCNLSCSCCQNYEISQTGVAGFPRLQQMTVEEAIRIAGTNPANIGIAYTYNEPFVWYEFMFDTAVKAKQEGFKNVVVSNGYINKEPLEALIEYIDAFNIDLKCFDNRIHKEFTGGELPFVKSTLSSIRNAGRHLEITMLVIPGINDDMQKFSEMVEWIINTLGKDVPLHLSRYFPRYRMDSPATPAGLLNEMAGTASEKLDFVYLGNVPGGNFQHTHCPECDALVIQRQGYYVVKKGLDADGNCTGCGHKITQAD